MRFGRAAISVLIVAVLLLVSGLAIISQRPSNVSTSSTSSRSSSQTTIINTASTYSSTTNNLLGGPLWTTYHMDDSRTGFDSSIQNLGRVASAWNSSNLDGAVYAEPLLADHMLFVATENNSVYALNESSGTQIWRTNLGTPIPGNSLPCGDIDPSGITGTPVIDASTGAIFVVAYVEPGAHELFSLNLKTGATIFERGIDPPGADVSVLQERGALALANGMVYVPYGGLDGDCGDYKGWVVGAAVNNTGPLVSYVVPTQREAGIWAPPGITVESSGDLLVATGNGASTSSSSFDYGDSVIALSPSLQVLGYWAPTDWASLNAGDTDIGSISPSLVGNNTVFQSGKNGLGYLLNENNLGGIGGEEYSGQVCDSAFGGTAYAAPLLFVPCTSGLFALRIDSGSTPSFTALWNATGYWAGPPIVAGGAVWTIDTTDSILYAYSLNNGTMLFEYQLGSVVTFETLTSGGGLIFLVDGTTVRALSI